MKERGDETPKGFICLGGKPIIEHSLEALISCGIREIMIVTGYKNEFFEKLKETYPEIETVQNLKFADTGTMDSLSCAHDFVDSDFILLESDLIYDPEAINHIINAPFNDCLLISGTTDAGDEVYVGGGENRVARLSKVTDEIRNPVGEYIGIAKISRKLYSRLQQVAKPLSVSNSNLSYDMDCFTEVAKEYQLNFIKIDGLDWAEIDDKNQLMRAQKVWERIKAKRP